MLGLQKLHLSFRALQLLFNPVPPLNQLSQLDRPFLIGQHDPLPLALQVRPLLPQASLFLFQRHFVSASHPGSLLFLPSLQEHLRVREKSHQI